MAIEKTISITGTLDEADVVNRIKLDDILMATGKLTKLFEYEASLPANTSNDPVDFQNATLASFVFIRVDVVDGGDCTVKITPQGGSEQSYKCDGGEIWFNKTAITAIRLSSVSGADVEIIGGGIS